MIMFPTPFTVGVRTYSETLNSRNEPVPSWSAPVDTPVYGWGPAGSSEPFEVGRDAITWDLDLLVPPSFSCDRRDRIVADGVEYTVEGRAQDYSANPFGFNPGATVRLRRVEG